MYSQKKYCPEATLSDLEEPLDRGSFFVYNMGVQGSHWASLFLNNELMTTTVFRPDGTIVPFMPTRESNVLESGWMDYEEYALLDEVFCQRDTLARLKRAQQHLAILMPEHWVVFIAKLTKDDEIFGRKYKAGKRWRLDSNTRAKNWSEGGSDAIPKEVFYIQFSYESCLRIQTSYNTFDSPDATEKTQEKLVGILSGMYRYQPKSSKLGKGQILTGLHKAACAYDPDTWIINDPVKGTELVGLLGVFLEEVKHLDNFMSTPSHWDQHCICAALLAIKKYGTQNDRLNKAFAQLDRMAMNNMEAEMDGVSHIVQEWREKDGTIFPNKNTKYTGRDNMDDTVPWILYCFELFMKNQKRKQITIQRKRGDKTLTSRQLLEEYVSPGDAPTPALPGL